MKTVKLTVLFKSGVEKSYIVHDMTDEEIKIVKTTFTKYVGKDSVDGSIALDLATVIISPKEIASVEIEILE